LVVEHEADFKTSGLRQQAGGRSSLCGDNMKSFVEVIIDRNGETQTVQVEKQRYEQIRKQVIAACRASVVTINGQPHTTEIVRLDKLFTDEIELAVGYQIAENLLAEAEPEEAGEMDDEGEL
jgi:formate dehydrogenase assembly factor FdhD